MRISILNYILFQAGWLACVLGAANGLPAIGPLAVAGVVVLHLVLARMPGREVALLALCAVMGGAFDSLLLATGWLAYPNGGWLPGIAPYWIIAMWVLFGTTLNLSMGWLRGRPLLAAMLGAIAAPLTYLGGARLGAMNLVEPAAALTALALGWAVMMPVLAAVARRWDGFSPAPLPAWVRGGWRDEQVAGNV